MQTTPKPILVANWKSHGNLKENKIWVEHFLAKPPCEGMDIVVCPPFPYIHQLCELCEGTAVAVGAQNVSSYEQGAYTGEVSAKMLRDLGCLYVIIGHSERRSLYAEDDKQLMQKLQRAIDCGLIPIFCVGETLQQRENSQTQEVLNRQLSAVASFLKGAPFVLAYEPIWAIGSGRTATPEQAQQAHGFLCECLSVGLGVEATEYRVIYGGSVKSDNAKALFAEHDVGGGLVGGASLQAEDFLQICKALEETKIQIN
ncbi:MAG: triose-phosphate isomerase [Gammaproteobacteria bacterium]|nr:triose-phosphate isomerase [Gammaproteobacteria bacterium]